MGFKITYISPLLKDEFPVDFIENQQEEIKLKNKFKFRLLDGDGNVYFEGYAFRCDSFNPLDSFGIDYGCTDLQYFENGKFVSL